MAYRCDRCDKGIVFSTQQRHKKGVAGGRWKKRAPKSRKISRPNLQTFRGILNGEKGKWRLCTKCLKIVKKGKKKPKRKLKVKVEKKKPALKKSSVSKSARKG